SRITKDGRNFEVQAAYLAAAERNIGLSLALAEDDMLLIVWLLKLLQKEGHC
ncbi:Hypothetical protein FKW44_011391, partial [Caligus rogercresseyi]